MFCGQMPFQLPYCDKKFTGTHPFFNQQQSPELRNVVPLTQLYDTITVPRGWQGVVARSDQGVTIASLLSANCQQLERVRPSTNVTRHKSHFVRDASLQVYCSDRSLSHQTTYYSYYDLLRSVLLVLLFVQKRIHFSKATFATTNNWRYGLVVWHYACYSSVLVEQFLTLCLWV